MPQLLLAAIVIAVAFYGYRAFTREAERVSARVRRAEREARNKAVGTLVQDPKTGVYKPVKDDD